MFKRLIQRVRDMKALSRLVESAEQYSQQRNEGSKPSVEHFVLAAINADDGAAKNVFTQLGLNATDFEAALRKQYVDSLSAIGIDVDDDTLRSSDTDITSKKIELPQVTESGSELMRNMADQNEGKPFSSADVLRALTSVPKGPAHRALEIMGTTAQDLAKAAEQH